MLSLRGIIPCAPLFAAVATGAFLILVEGDGLFGAGHRRGGDSDLPTLVRGRLCLGGAGQDDTGGFRAGYRGAVHLCDDDRAATATLAAWFGGLPVAAWPPSPPARRWNFCRTGTAHHPGPDRLWTAVLVPDTGTCLISLSLPGGRPATARRRNGSGGTCAVRRRA
ncbi:MAG: hypothetical protein INF50_00905 [Rhodobacter sp.]|nr:hypothetical protein [Rhodobacter sp.]